MPKGLYIGATSPFAGKSMMAIGIGLNLQKKGINFGYMKPVGNAPLEHNGSIIDEDATFARESFGITDDEALITPVKLTQDFKMRIFGGSPESPLDSITTAYKRLSEHRQTMLVAGTGHCFSGAYCGIDSLSIANALDLSVIVVDRIENEAHYDLLLTLKSQLGDRMLGAVLNDVPPSFLPEVESVVKPFLERKGIKTLGVIPSDPFMRSIRACDLAEHLGGRLVSAKNDANKMVESFLIGTMQVENFMTYFRRQPNSAVIVGGDRADVQLVAIEGECPCLVLTGNLFPNDIILSRAETLKVPVIMVRGDTYSVAHRMETLLNSSKMRDVKKIRQGSQMVESSLDFTTISAAMGI